MSRSNLHPTRRGDCFVALRAPRNDGEYMGEHMTSNDFRKEKDSLGELNVPASAYYGVQTQRAVDNFPISGLHPWRAFIWSIAAVKHAAALVNFELGLFNDRD